MIFVYPVVCSDALDNRILPAICKSLEKFYLSNICEAFSSGVLTPKSKWNPFRKIYGPIVLENTEKHGSVINESNGFSDIITEANVFADMSTINTAKGSMPPADRSKIDQHIRQLNQLNNINSDLERVEAELRKLMDSADHVMVNAADRNANRYVVSKFTSDLTRYRNLSQSYHNLATRVAPLFSDWLSTFGSSVLGGIGTQVADDIRQSDRGITSFCNRLDNAYKELIDRNKDIEKTFRDNQKEIDARADKQYERQLDIQDRERQQRERDAESYRSHGGSWKMSEVHGIGFDATMATVEVRIQYVGGDYDSRNVYNSDARVNLPVGVKLIPNVVPGDSIRYALLSDAFRSKNDQFITSVGRSAGRQFIKWGERFVKWLTGHDVDLARTVGEDEVSSQVLYAPQHLINASGFKRRPGSSDFYQYTSGVVILNKEELREIDDLLNDRNFMNRIIRLGWNSICVMDDVGEEALFISTVDGGYIHRLPYAYIFSSIGMTTTYDNIDKLQKHSGPFNRSDGRGFTPFGQKIMKESFCEMFDRIDNERNKSDRRSSDPVSLDSDAYYR